MKIKIEQIKPNPFRNMDRYPIDRAKIEALKNSINETGFWDNIVARPKNGNFEIAYGHHRWIAIQELGFKQVDIPVREFSDAMMIKIMAEENLNWTTHPAVINETVRAAKAFLDAELQKYEDWRHAGKSTSVMFASNSQFQQCKRDGVGRVIILKFLGPNWKEWVVKEALETLEAEKRGEIDRVAVESLGTVDRASQFRHAVKDYKVPKAKQAHIAKEIRSKDVPSKQVRLVVQKNMIADSDPKSKDIYKELEILIKNIDDQARSLDIKLKRLRRSMAELGIKQLRGIRTWLAASSLKRLYDSLSEIRKDIDHETDR